MICQYIETKKEEFGAWPICKVLTGAGVKIAPSSSLTPAVAGLLAPGACATRACQGFCVSGLQVGCESVGVGGGELGQGLVPVGGDLSFDELALGFALGWWQSFLLVTFSGSFVLNVADRQPQQLDHRLIGGEVAAVLGDLAQLVVQRLDTVGGGGTSHEVGER